MSKLKRVDTASFRVVGPCMEAAGSYWITDYDGRVPGEDVYVVGDSNGTFRGLTAAHVSGYYAARKIVDSLPSAMLSLSLRPRVVTSIVNERGYMQRMPPLVANDGGPAQYEIHVFLGPLMPPPEIVDKFEKAVERWNVLFRRGFDMKACHLGLLLQDNKTEIRVMQSARYYRTKDVAEVVEAAHRDALWFVARGFVVLRVKIEAAIHGQNVPDIDTPDQKHLYYEFHIKTKLCGDAEADIATLLELSKKFSAQFERPVPLSINRGKGGQRFLNVRFSGCTKQAALDKVRRIKEALGDLYSKEIDELVVYDTCRKMDRGWIEFE
jgi:hypothetical protein